MTTNIKNIESGYYFVPFGRERGGYLDTLRLPPSATEIEAANADKAYRLDLDRDFKSKRKILREEKLRTEIITKEEFDAQVSEWEEEKTRKLTELNDLKKAFEATQAKRRELENKGLKDDNIVWLDMYQSFGQTLEEAWETVIKRQIVSYIAPQLLETIEKYWIKRGFTNKEQKLGDILPSGSIANSKDYDLSLLRLLVIERDLIRLLSADALWSKLRYTNREFWQKKVNDWTQEIIELGPYLRKDKVAKDYDSLRPEFPSLCEPYPLSIENLTEEELEDISKLPDRSGDITQRLDLGALLSALLAQNNAATDPEGSSRGRSSTTSVGPRDDQEPSTSERKIKIDIGEFMRFLDLMSRSQNEE